MFFLLKVRVCFACLATNGLQARVVGNKKHFTVGLPTNLLNKDKGNGGLQQNEKQNTKAATMINAQRPRRKAAATKKAALVFCFEWLKLQAATCTNLPITFACC